MCVVMTRTLFKEELHLFTSLVSSGSVTVNEDSSVQILAEEAVELDTLDSKVRLSSCRGPHILL